MAASTGKKSKQNTPTRPEILEEISGSRLNGHAPLRVLTTEFKIQPEGQMDALAVDQTGRVVGIQMGPKTDEQWMAATLDSMAWLEQNLSLLPERFPTAGLAANLPPRLLLVSPEFSPRTLRRLETLSGLDLSLLEARWIELAGEKRLSLKPAGRAGNSMPAWALTPETAALLQEVVNKSAKFGPDVDLEWGPRRLDLLTQGSLLAHFVPLRSGLRVVIPGKDRQDTLIQDLSQLKRHLDTIFRTYLSMNLGDLQMQQPPADQFLPQAEIPAMVSQRAGVLSAEEMEAFSK